MLCNRNAWLTPTRLSLLADTGFGLWNIQQLLQLRVIVNGKAIHALILSLQRFSNIFDVVRRFTGCERSL
jgi:hypothetical protein